MELDLALIREELTEVEKAIDDALADTSPRLRLVATHLVAQGGKRFRPALGISVYRAAGGTKSSRMVPVAAAIELIHTATLIHDDLNDQSATRRGVKATHRKYGRASAIVAGDFLFAKAFGMVANVERRIIDVAAQACCDLAEGEFVQMNTPLQRMTEESYLDMVRLKTGSLMRAGARSAAILAKGQPDQIESMTRYGSALGVAFQITDDYLDVIGGNGWGKPVGADMLSGKATLVSVHALAASTPRERETLLAAHAKRGKGEQHLTKAIKIMDRHGSIDYTRKVARSYIKRARKELGVMPQGPYLKQLRALTDYAVLRAH